MTHTLKSIGFVSAVRISAIVSAACGHTHQRCKIEVSANYSTCRDLNHCGHTHHHLPAAQPPLQILGCHHPARSARSRAGGGGFLGGADRRHLDRHRRRHLQYLRPVLRRHRDQTGSAASPAQSQSRSRYRLVCSPCADRFVHQLNCASAFLCSSSQESPLPIAMGRGRGWGRTATSRLTSALNRFIICQNYRIEPATRVRATFRPGVTQHDHRNSTAIR